MISIRKAVYPGSFDPVTFGHLDIIERAAKLFDTVIVLISDNPLKRASFELSKRREFLKRVTWHLKNVVVDVSNGLIVDYFQQNNADVIVKGLRAMSDFEYEVQMALINKDLCKKAETIFLCADASITFLSSSAVKQIAMFGGDISKYVPNEILPEIINRLQVK